MTDRELLELAAKAAGLGLPTDKDTDEIGRQYADWLGLWTKAPWGWNWFNPLTDDGDALRLAVKLWIEPDFRSGTVRCFGESSCCIESTDYDPYAATRRAIVRAAAEIGRSMK